LILWIIERIDHIGDILHAFIGTLLRDGCDVFLKIEISTHRFTLAGDQAELWNQFDFLNKNPTLLDIVSIAMTRNSV